MCHTAAVMIRCLLILVVGCFVLACAPAPPAEVVEPDHGAGTVIRLAPELDAIVPGDYTIEQVEDGFEFIERLRRLAPSLPIVLCTRLAGVQSWSDAVFAALGVEAVLVRPVRFGQAAWTLEQVLEGLEGGTASLRMPIPDPRG